ncbi:MAG: Two component regulator three Y domain-containing protein, partial [Eudoraea sp.]
DTTCGDNNGIITLIPDTNFGVPPYEYSDDGVTFSSQNIFSGFAPGPYSGFVIRDSRGCTTPVLSATINGSVPVDATVVANNAICAAGTVEGSIDITGITNGTANYTYTILDITGTAVTTVGPTPSTAVNIPNLIPGTYTVVTVDASGCEDRDTVTITQNQIDLVPVSVTTPPDCTTAFTYIVDIVGGTAPYQIGLVGTLLGAPNVDADTHDFTGQIAYGVTYFVEVVDFLGCRYIEQIDPIAGPSPIAIAATATTASCTPGGNGQIDFEVTGIGSPADITIQLQDTNTGAFVGAPIVLTNEPIPYNGSFPGLPPGNYQILVQDDNTSCDASALVDIITDIPTLVVDNNEPANCNVGALVTVRGTGGTPGYSFAYVPTGSAPPVTFSTQTTFEIAGPYSADYDFYIQDASGCVSFTTVTVTEDPGVPTPTVDVVNQCTAVANYTVNMTAPLSTGSGLPDETFEYDIGGGFQSSPNFIVANPGDYIITVRDGNGCTNSVPARVFDYFAITASATTEPTCNAGDGIITVNTTGGSGTFEFQLRDNLLNPIGPPQSSNTFINVFPGDYDILVTDLLSNTPTLCTDNAIVNVTIVDTPDISATPKNDITCNGANDGNITVELTPGSDTDS